MTSIQPIYFIMQGSLKIKVVKAVMEKDADFFSKMDPYAIVNVGRQRQKTKVASKMGKKQVWNQDFVFKITGETEIKISMYDEDMMTDDFLGSLVIPLKQFENGQPVDREFQVLDKKNHHAGMITLRIEFQNSGTANLGKPTNPQSKKGEGMGNGQAWTNQGPTPQPYGTQQTGNYGMNQSPSMPTFGFMTQQTGNAFNPRPQVNPAQPPMMQDYYPPTDFGGQFGNLGPSPPQPVPPFQGDFTHQQTLNRNIAQVPGTNYPPQSYGFDRQQTANIFPNQPAYQNPGNLNRQVSVQQNQQFVYPPPGSYNPQQQFSNPFPPQQTGNPTLPCQFDNNFANQNQNFAPYEQNIGKDLSLQQLGYGNAPQQDPYGLPPQAPGFGFPPQAPNSFGLRQQPSLQNGNPSQQLTNQNAGPYLPNNHFGY